MLLEILRDQRGQPVFIGEAEPAAREILGFFAGLYDVLIFEVVERAVEYAKRAFMRDVGNIRRHSLPADESERVKRRSRRAAWRAAAFRLEFDREVTGPLCLAHASHFGLGLFLPAE